MKKYFTLLMMIFLFCNANGQSKKKKKTSGAEIYFGLGILLDNQAGIPYVGPQILNLGYYRLLEKKIRGLELEGSYFNITGLDKEDDLKDLKHYSGEVKAYQLYKLKAINQIQIYGGFSLSLLLRRDKFIPYNIQSFSSREIKIYGGGGGKLLARINMNSRLIFLIQSNLTILDMGINRTQIDNPLLAIRSRRSTKFAFEFLRRRTNFLIGISLKLK